MAADGIVRMEAFYGLYAYELKAGDKICTGEIELSPPPEEARCAPTRDLARSPCASDETHARAVVKRSSDVYAQSLIWLRRATSVLERIM
eukprot:784616-Pleurochrysis_carterae.AAC.1